MKEAIEEQILQYLYRFEVAVPQAAQPAEEPPDLSQAEPASLAAGGGGSMASRRAADELFGARGRRPASTELSFQGAHDPSAGGDFTVETKRGEGPKVGRNDPCPCGSGKKYKKCHGAKHGE
jgi:preprotein translocase subunit SecA